MKNGEETETLDRELCFEGQQLTLAKLSTASPMKTLLTLLLFAIVLVLCWPLALLILICWPILWLLSIPFRIVGAILHGLIAFVSALFLLPARLLGYRG